jgi:hypothetical protein
VVIRAPCWAWAGAASATPPTSAIMAAPAASARFICGTHMSGRVPTAAGSPGSPDRVVTPDGIATMTAELDEDSGIRLLFARDSPADRERACRRATELLAGIDGDARPWRPQRATAAGRNTHCHTDADVLSRDVTARASNSDCGVWSSTPDSGSRRVVVPARCRRCRSRWVTEIFRLVRERSVIAGNVISSHSSLSAAPC